MSSRIVNIGSALIISVSIDPKTETFLDDFSTANTKDEVTKFVTTYISEMEQSIDRCIQAVIPVISKRELNESSTITIRDEDIVHVPEMKTSLSKVRSVLELQAKVTIRNTSHSSFLPKKPRAV